MKRVQDNSVWKASFTRSSEEERSAVESAQHARADSTTHETLVAFGDSTGHKRDQDRPLELSSEQGAIGIHLAPYKNGKKW
jgi:hypothetical protein